MAFFSLQEATSNVFFFMCAMRVTFRPRNTNFVMAFSFFVFENGDCRSRFIAPGSYLSPSKSAVFVGLGALRFARKTNALFRA